MPAQCISTTKIVIALFYWQCVMPITYLPLLILERTEEEVMVEFSKIHCWDLLQSKHTLHVFVDPEYKLNFNKNTY